SMDALSESVAEFRLSIKRHSSPKSMFISRSGGVERPPAERLQSANVFTGVGRILAAIDGVGAGAVPAQRPGGFALQSDLVRLAASVDVPEQDTTGAIRFGVAIRQMIAVGARRAFTGRSRQGGTHHDRRSWLHGRCLRSGFLRIPLRHCIARRPR